MPSLPGEVYHPPRQPLLFSQLEQNILRRMYLSPQFCLIRLLCLKSWPNSMRNSDVSCAHFCHCRQSRVLLSGCDTHGNGAMPRLDNGSISLRRPRKRTFPAQNRYCDNFSLVKIKTKASLLNTSPLTFDSKWRSVEEMSFASYSYPANRGRSAFPIMQVSLRTPLLSLRSACFR